MKKGEILEGRIEKVDFPNRGIIRMDNRQVIVKNGIPGQKVRFSVSKVRKGKCEGRILEVTEPSPLEVAPDCIHFASCGGCTYRNMSYEEQLRLKEAQIKELLDSVCRDYHFEGIKASPLQEGYRNKMEFSFGDEEKDGPLALGMHKRGSFYDIVTVNDCRIVHPDFRKILACVLEFARGTGLPFYHKLSHQGYFRHLLVRRAVKTEEILIDLVTSTQASPDLTPMREALLKLPLEGRIAGILHTSNDSLADVIQNDHTDLLYGQDYFYEELLGLKFKISPFSFFQTNSLGAEVLYETARTYIGETKDKVIFDLYSGTGTIAQILAPVAKHVTGVEIVEEAVEAARENAALNGLDNCSFLAGDVLKVIDELTEKPDLIVLDPPRDGIHPKALGKIIRFGVERMVYISCKPTSLVRDLEVLQASRYQVERVCCVDMFPGTGHVETVALLTKKAQ
ncbi:MAG: 23S rRNA (uracil(1939)-C(5))-methyltransferase RlmD [Lachnospiraceae bacterium]|nr:23S rRNA (uracil(1939)-C(5))-methyltransferase RlmD [Lachnospiraceae bacterium]